ncbi:uncharacterized protein LOC120889783 isoform X3 [Ictidomys tridecemlineatus]
MVKTSGEESTLLSRSSHSLNKHLMVDMEPCSPFPSSIERKRNFPWVRDLLKNCLARMYLKIRRENMSTGFTFFIFAHVGQICTIGEHLVGAPIKSKWQLGNHSKV